jgi:hypothetical protein
VSEFDRWWCYLLYVVRFLRFRAAVQLIQLFKSKREALQLSYMRSPWQNQATLTVGKE